MLLTVNVRLGGSLLSPALSKLIHENGESGSLLGDP